MEHRPPSSPRRRFNVSRCPPRPPRAWPGAPAMGRPRAPRALAALLDLVADEPSAITRCATRATARDAHVADSLVALDPPVVRAARRIADLGSGGDSALALAIALPSARRRWRARAQVRVPGRARQTGSSSATSRSSRLARRPGRQEHGGHDLVVARALAALPVLVEYAAPLLSPGGSAGRLEGSFGTAEEADGRAAAALGTSEAAAGPSSRSCGPRSISLPSSKVSPTPTAFRAGPDGPQTTDRRLNLR